MSKFSRLRQQARQRLRKLVFETLSQRQLLAADLPGLDVNQDGYLSGVDVLQIVNALNANAPYSPHLDVNRDAAITPIDVLLVVNAINTGGSSLAEADAPNQPPLAVDDVAAWSTVEHITGTSLDALQGAQLVDSAGFGVGHVVNMGPTNIVPAPFGSGLAFTQAGQYAVIDPTAQLNALGSNGADFSLSFHYRLDEAANGKYRVVLFKGNNGLQRGPGVWMRPDSDRLHVRLATTSGYNEGLNSSRELTLGQWTHVAITKQASQWSLYLDGQLDSQVNLTGASLGNDGPLYLGATPWQAGGRAAMDEVELFAQALSRPEIQLLAGRPQQPFQRASGNVSSNDSDPDGDSLSFQVISSAADSVLELSPTGSYLFAAPQVPASGLLFTYQATDAAGNQDQAEVRVASSNLSPNAVDDVFALSQVRRVADTSFETVAGSQLKNVAGDVVGQVVNMTATDLVPASFGNALKFSQAGQYARLEPTPALNNLGTADADFSLSFWYRLDEQANGKFRGVLLKGNNNNERGPGLWMRPDNNRLHVRLSTSAGFNEGLNSLRELSVGEWTHVSVVKSGNQWSLYLNAQLDTRVTLAGASLGNQGPLYVGGTPWQTGAKAAIDELEVFAKPLSETELLWLQTHPQTPYQLAQGNVGLNDSDPENGSLRFTPASVSNNGYLDLAPGGNFIFLTSQAPSDGQLFSYTASDSAGNSDQAVVRGGMVPIAFGKSTLTGATTLTRPTSLQFGPDGRLYVSEQTGLIYAYTVVRNGPNDYSVTATEVISLIKNIPNHDDMGNVVSLAPKRLVTGLLVTGTPSAPVLYVSSSDPRIGAGPSGTDLNLDTNSGIISRLTRVGNSWQKLDLVRGLPRSEENHGPNGLQLDPQTNTLYVAHGGNTNQGGPSNNFAFLPEFALSAAILAIDLDAIGETTYDLPTLDDEDRPGTVDFNDPFGGNNGKNQAILTAGSPVQVYAPGFRNPYDLVITSKGRMYAFDNGANSGWGTSPVNEGPAGNATNDPVAAGNVGYGDGLHFITGPGYYGGHPNPTRSNPANTFNPSNPQSPVSVANPIESDFRSPSENGSLVVNASSTNGIAEYTSDKFGGALQGDLLAVGFTTNSIQRIKLDASGTTAVSVETLFSNVGFRPLDVTTPGGTLAGTVWVVDVATNQVIVFEPADGSSGAPGDADGDGYSDEDETANGTDPHNPADAPADNDQDFLSNLLDDDDDNDSLLDQHDPFAIDAHNGSNTPIGFFYDWENEGASLGGLLGLGFTGIMTNGSDNYRQLFDPGAVTAGGAAGVFTIDAAGGGTARGSTNTQQQALQIGFHVNGQQSPFVAKTSIVDPFDGLLPSPGQQMGFYLGLGDQDNYMQLVLAGDNGGSIQLAAEIAGVYTTLASLPLSMPGLGYVELHLTVDPQAQQLQASYSVDGGAFVLLGGPVAVPTAWLTDTMAVGLISTNPSNVSFPVTWDFLAVEHASPLQALVEFIPPGGINNSSTFSPGSFRITNTSGLQSLQRIAIDISSVLLPDIVFDPNGTAGDAVAKALTVDSGGIETGYQGVTYSQPLDGGFTKIELVFGDFGPGESMTFSIDIDPTSVKGTQSPGPSHAGSVSGLELSGAVITLTDSYGTTLQAETVPVPGSQTHSRVALAQATPLAVPTLQLLGQAVSPSTLSSPQQTVRISGPAGANVRLLVAESALHIEGAGFDIDPYETNKIIGTHYLSVVIGAAGFVDVPVTLQDTIPEGGISKLAAWIETADGRTGGLSNVLTFAVGDLPPDSPASSVKINAGGAQLGDWETDNGHVSAGSGIFTTGKAVNVTHPSLPAGIPQELFKTERYASPNLGGMQWTFAVTPGQYEVRLYFAEIWAGAFSPGARVFNVSIENSLKLDHYDVFADVGSLKGVMKSFIVSSDAELNIDFQSITQNAMVNALEIIAL